ncbi:conserved hypothetical protein [uncultured Desulfobacterium sp.]|uniref:Cytoskeleton protein RodZ-like C-terminal domain-containing protein n=1 Tax=uncultured Desulfobacterium sp. TaxID=201089 RepID=A0A445MWW2_9BACT|nr:conserved hypothetical protein [uncultured Desulfobacterium sp.]
MKSEISHKQGAGSSEPEPADQGQEKAQPLLSIGALLREERQKKGLSLTKVSEITRLRPYIIESLENEAWDKLPPPAFVSGFVRSYGRALGLKEVMLLDMFHKACPVKADSPRPLTKPVRSKRPLIVLILVLLLAVAVGFALWKRGYINIKDILKINKAPEAVSLSVQPQGEVEVPNVQSPPAPAQEKEVSKETVPEAANNILQPNPAPAPVSQDVGQPKAVQEDVVVPASVATPAESPAAVPEQTLTLKANIREKTWMRVFVDEQEPREYMFMPNEYFVWNGKKGFELLIGNAAGIELDLNGQQIKTLGAPGQVIKLSLPSGYKREQAQD